MIACICWEDTSEPFRLMFFPETEGLADAKLDTAIFEDGAEHFADFRRVPCVRYDDLAVYPYRPILFPLRGWGKARV